MILFAGNNEKEKAQLNVKTRTVSLWSYVNNPEILRTFVNALYEPNDSVLWPSVAPQSLVFSFAIIFFVVNKAVTAFKSFNLTCLCTENFVVCVCRAFKVRTLSTNSSDILGSSIPTLDSQLERI